MAMAPHISAVVSQEKAKAKKDPFTCHKELATTEAWCKGWGKDLRMYDTYITMYRNLRTILGV